MNRITLNQFIENTKGKKIALPNGHQEGQCVSLVQQYINQCLGQPIKPRGNAKDWTNTYVSEGLGVQVKTPQRGDLLVFPRNGKLNGILYGHIAIYIDKNKLYDQNNNRHDNSLAGYGSIFSNDYIILHPNTELLPEDKPDISSDVLKVGDKVEIIATGNGNSFGTSNTAYGLGWTRYITKIYSDREFPYQVGNKGKTDSLNTTGFYTQSALRKIK